MLMNAGANLTSSQSEEVTFEKSPAFYAISLDRCEALEVLMKHGLSQHHNITTMLHVAIDMYAIQCTEYLVTKAHDEKDRNMEVLSLASSRGINFIKAILGIGYSYDLIYFKENPQLLKQYYSNVGLNKKHLESSCSEFTCLILDDYNGKSLLHEHLNVDLLHTVLMRCGCSCRSVQEAYQDIQCTIEQLLNYRPELVSELTHEMVETTLGNFRAPCFKSNELENYVCNINLLTFLIAKGCLIKTKFIAFVEAMSRPSQKRHWSCEQQIVLANALIKCAEAFLSTKSDNLKLELCLRNSGINEANITYRLAYYTRAIPLLHKQGLDFYMLPVYKKHPRRHAYLMMKSGNIPTHFQSTVIEFADHLMRKPRNIHQMALLFSTIILLVGQWVDFSREVTNQVGFQSMCNSLIKLLENAPEGPTNDNGTDWLSDQAVGSAVMHVFHMFMLFLDRRNQLTVLSQIYLHFPTVEDPGCVQRYVEDYIQDNLNPLTQNNGLKHGCFLCIRKQLHASGHFETQLNIKDGDTRRRRLVKTHNKSPGEEEEKEETCILDVLSAEGLYVDGPSLMESKIRRLPLPPSLMEYLLRHNEMDTILSMLWEIYLNDGQFF